MTYGATKMEWANHLLSHPEKDQIALIVATTGRPELIGGFLQRLNAQRRPPNYVILVPCRATDLPEDLPSIMASVDFKVIVVHGQPGLPNQRNAGLRWVRNNTRIFDTCNGIIVFFDDDFVARDDWFEKAAKTFATNSSIVGLTGFVVADGVKGEGYSAQQALLFIKNATAKSNSTKAVNSLYGCNMAIRAQAAVNLYFDETLPLYGWQEDVDYSCRLSRKGLLLEADSLVGVHLGVKNGRVPGLCFGYSQISNPIYLMRKGTMCRKKTFYLISKNILANTSKFFWPEQYVDRRGRLKGNILGLFDLSTGKLDPQRILKLGRS